MPLVNKALPTHSNPATKPAHPLQRRGGAGTHEVHEDQPPVQRAHPPHLAPAGARRSVTRHTMGMQICQPVYSNICINIIIHC